MPPRTMALYRLVCGKLDMYGGTRLPRTVGERDTIPRCIRMHPARDQQFMLNIGPPNWDPSAHLTLSQWYRI